MKSRKLRWASGSFLMISSNLVSNVEEKDEGDWKSAIEKRWRIFDS